MKCLIFLLLVSTPVLASKNKTWVPSYKKKMKTQAQVKQVPQQAKLKKIGKKKIQPTSELERLFLVKPKTNAHFGVLKKKSLEQKQAAVPTLIKVMKSKSYPSENRWVATYMLGRIMGKKSAPFISKFSKHPNWMLRLASLKVLLHLGQKQYKGIYAQLLEDKSLIVRHQALQNIREMKLVSLAPYVWKMLYNKENYLGLKGSRKRSNIIKDAIKVVGELGFKGAKKPMLKMFQKNKYKDVYAELDYSLSKLDRPSPAGSLEIKKHFWMRQSLKEVTI
jgi:HEAT repeat protein